MNYSRSDFRFDSRAARARLAARTMLCPYNGRLINPSDLWDAEHIVALKQSWEHGFANMMISANGQGDGIKKVRHRMRRFANDPLNIIPVIAGSNRSRGSHTSWNWLPLNLAYIQKRNEITKQIYEKYGLTLQPEQIFFFDWWESKLKNHRLGVKPPKIRAWLLRNNFPLSLMPSF